MTYDLSRLPCVFTLRLITLYQLIKQASVMYFPETNILCKVTKCKHRLAVIEGTYSKVDGHVSATRAN